MKQKIKKGFTLVEMTIAIAFISILLITIALVTADVVNTYRKGLSMKSVNTVGLDLIDNFSSAISSAPVSSYENLCEYFMDKRDNESDTIPRAECLKDKAYKFTFQEYKKDIKINGDSEGYRMIAGAFCTGKYSYVWSTGYVFDKDSYKLASDSGNGYEITAPVLRYRYGGQERELTNFRLLRFLDSTRNLCMANLVDTKNDKLYTYDVRGNIEFDVRTTAYGTEYNLEEEPVELIPESGKLALYGLVIFPPIQDPTSKQYFYSASMILATIAGGVDILATGDYCSPPGDVFSDFNYCAVNKFNFAMRASGV